MKVKESGNERERKELLQKRQETLRDDRSSVKQQNKQTSKQYLVTRDVERHESNDREVEDRDEDEKSDLLLGNYVKGVGFGLLAPFQEHD